MAEEMLQEGIHIPLYIPQNIKIYQNKVLLNEEEGKVQHSLNILIVVGYNTYVRSRSQKVAPHFQPGLSIL